ncbi:hypothetical protein [Candidatus Bealeia paramacronuclearis]
MTTLLSALIFLNGSLLKAMEDPNSKGAKNITPARPPAKQSGEQVPTQISEKRSALPFLNDSIEELIEEIDDYLKQHIAIKKHMINALDSIINDSCSKKQIDVKKSQEKLETILGRPLNEYFSNQKGDNQTKELMERKLIIRTHAKAIKTHQEFIVKNAEIFKHNLYLKLSQGEYVVHRNTFGAYLVSAWANGEIRSHTNELENYEEETRQAERERRPWPHADFNKKVLEDQIEFYEKIAEASRPHWSLSLGYLMDCAQFKENADHYISERTKILSDLSLQKIKEKCSPENYELQKNENSDNSKKDSKKNKKIGKKKTNVNQELFPSEEGEGKIIASVAESQSTAEETTLSNNNGKEESLTSPAATHSILAEEESTSLQDEDTTIFDPLENHKNHQVKKNQKKELQTKPKEEVKITYDTSHFSPKHKAFFKSLFDKNSEIAWDSLKNLMKTAFKGKIYGTRGASRQFAVFLKKGEKGTIEFVEELEFNRLRSQSSTKGTVQRLAIHTEAPHTRGGSKEGARFLYPALKELLKEALTRNNLTPEKFGW